MANKVWTFRRRKNALARFEAAVLDIAFIGTLEARDPRRDDMRKAYTRARKDMEDILRI